MKILPEDWAAIFAPETPLLELVVRGAALYLGLVALMRIMPRRSEGELAMADLVLALLIAEAAAHAMGVYESVADGLIQIMVIMGCNYLVDALSYHVPLIDKLVSAPPLPIIRDGQLLRRNMRQEFLTEDELLSQLRQEGIDDVRQVKLAHIEGDGQITVIQYKEDEKP